MEVAGFAISVISLASLLETGFEIHDRIKAVKDASDTLADIVSRSELEIRKLHYFQKKCKANLLDKDALEVLTWVQIQVNTRLRNILSTVAKYSSSQEAPAQGSSNVSPGTMSPLEKLANTHKVSRNPKRILKWIAEDKDYLEEQLLRLQNLVDTIWKLSNSGPERVREDYKLMANIISAADNSVLGTVKALPVLHYTGIAKAARVKELLSRSLSDSSPPTSELMQPRYMLPVASISWECKNLTESAVKPWALGAHEVSGIGISEIPVIVEWRGPFMGRKAKPLIEKRLDDLCEFLGAMYSAEIDNRSSHSDVYARQVDFRVLKCVGWTRSSDSFDRIGLAFEYPYRDASRPESLRSKILTLRAQRRMPPLGDRFDLAFGLCNAVANIASIGWMHRTICSDNMLLFDRRSIRDIYLIGYTYARPGLDKPDDEFPELSSLPNHRGFALYRPDMGEHVSMNRLDDDESDGTEISNEMDQLSLSITPEFQDIYGLGIVLLEIGLWDIVENMMKKRRDSSIRDFQAHGIKEPLQQLSGRCGVIYRNVVEKCLDHSNWHRDTIVENLGDVLGELKKCRA